jgi:putrescine transport system ATP-binding protein
MNQGRVAQLGSAADIYERPGSRFVADFVGAVNLFDGVLVAGFNALALAAVGIETPLSLPVDVRLPEGTAVALAVRPEKLRLSATRPAGIAIEAIVASINYQGAVSIVHVNAATGQALKAQMPSAEAAAYGRSDVVWASWDPADAVVITR